MRPSWDEHFIGMAAHVAKMSTCARRQVGCVLVDENRHVVSMGFNGTPPGWEHCRDNPNSPCPGKDAPSGTALDGCWSNHAEANALLRCPDPLRPTTCYCTASPCISCVKMLLCTSIYRIVFLDEYPHPEARDLWTWRSAKFNDGFREVLTHRTWEKIELRSSDPQDHRSSPVWILGSSK